MPKVCVAVWYSSTAQCIQPPQPATPALKQYHTVSIDCQRQGGGHPHNEGDILSSVIVQKLKELLSDSGSDLKTLLSLEHVILQVLQNESEFEESKWMTASAISERHRTDGVNVLY